MRIGRAVVAMLCAVTAPIVASCGTTGGAPSAAAIDRARTLLESLDNGGASELTISVASSMITTTPAQIVSDPRAVLEALRLEIDSPAHAVASGTDERVTVKANETPVAQVVTLGALTSGRIFVANLSALHLRLSASQQQAIARAGAALTGWYRLPSADLTRSTASALRDALMPLASTATSNRDDVRLAGATSGLTRAIEPEISAVSSLLTGVAISAIPVGSGRFTASLTAGRSELRSIRIVGDYDGVTATVTITVAHAPLAITAPSGVRPFPRGALASVRGS